MKALGDLYFVRRPLLCYWREISMATYLRILPEHVQQSVVWRYCRLGNSGFSKVRAMLVMATAAAIPLFIWLHKRFRRSVKKRQKILLKPEIILVEDVAAWDKISGCVVECCQQYPVLGMDCEWNPTCTSSEDSEVSLLQLATATGLCVLIRLKKLHYIPRSLVELLQDARILKAGVAVVDEDKKKLRCSRHAIIAAGCIDLRYVIASIDHPISKFQNQGSSLGLKFLSEKLLGLDSLDKSVQRTSRWDAELLSEPQLTYAALDALCSLQVFKVVMEDKFGTHDIPNFSEICQTWIDVKFSQKLLNTMINCKPGERTHPNEDNRHATSDYNGAKLYEGKLVALRQVKEGGRMKLSVLPRRKELYENCRMEAPDGSLLCMCGVKKVNWYLCKSLADIVEKEPLTIRLRFEPAGRPDSASSSLCLLSKSNKCVVCGATQFIARKFIVPYDYRQHFPRMHKSHDDHDIVPMCAHCHQTTGLHDNALRRHFAQVCQAPLNPNTKQYIVDRKLRTVKLTAKTLMKFGAELPPSRRKELENILKEHFQVDVVDGLSFLEMAAEVQTEYPDPSYIPHGKKVVQHMVSHDSLVHFQHQWRENFVHNMSPRFLPEGWSVDYGGH